MTKCPHCGSDDSYSYTVYGLVELRGGAFGHPESDEAIELRYTKPLPKYAKCDKCGKRIKLSKEKAEE